MPYFFIVITDVKVYVLKRSWYVLAAALLIITNPVKLLLFAQPVRRNAGQQTGGHQILSTTPRQAQAAKPLKPGLLDRRWLLRNSIRAIGARTVKVIRLRHGFSYRPVSALNTRTQTPGTSLISGLLGGAVVIQVAHFTLTATAPKNITVRDSSHTGSLGLCAA